MPTWMRLFHINQINEHNKKQNEEIKKSRDKNTPQSKPLGPNINPSSVYNY